MRTGNLEPPQSTLLRFIPVAVVGYYFRPIMGRLALTQVPYVARRSNPQQTEKLPTPTAKHATASELRSIESMQPEDRSDFDLLKLYVKKKSAEAFETLVTRHRRQVYNFVYKMVGKAEAAEDIFQETFLRVIKNAHTYTPRAKFTTWCLQIARNLSLDYFKREGLRQHLSIDASPGGGDDDRSIAGLLKGTDPESADVLISRELVEEVREAVTQLPDNQREALILRMYDDLPYAEIAEVLGSPEGTVKYWVHEAVNSLAKYLERKGLK